MWWFIRLVGALLTSAAAILLIVAPVVFEEIESARVESVLYTVMATLLWMSLGIDRPWRR